MMFYSQYLRVEKQAGGVGCTDAEFIRSAHTLLLKRSRFHHIHRAQRHAWLREGLALLAQSRAMYADAHNRGDYWIVGKMRGASQ
jgi:hypothetical protein